MPRKYTHLPSYIKIQPSPLRTNLYIFYPLSPWMQISTAPLVSTQEAFLLSQIQVLMLTFQRTYF